MELRRTMGGATAGAVAAAVWAAQQPLDKRLFRSDHDDVELLGKLLTRDSGWQAPGLALHMANGAVFGAVYALLRPLVPLPPLAAGAAAGLAELAPLSGNRRAFAQVAWRHVVFGVVLGELERRLNAEGEFEPLEGVPVSSNGHGNIEHAAVGATES